MHSKDDRSAVLDKDGTELLSGRSLKKGEKLTLKHNDVMIIETI